MTLVLIILLTVALIVQSVRAYRFKQELEDPTHHELLRVRIEAAEAERKLYDLTREAFINMTERTQEKF